MIFLCDSLAIRWPRSRKGTASAAHSFPAPVVPGVYPCGFHDPSSFGAAPWLIARSNGNVLVDVPRFSAPLARRIEALGPVKWLFLTHRDNVAEHSRWAQRLGCERIIHVRDQNSDTADVETVITGDQPVPLAPDLLMIPTPGHTVGSMCLLWQDQVLFSGDHLAWSLTDNQTKLPQSLDAASAGLRQLAPGSDLSQARLDGVRLCDKTTWTTAQRPAEVTREDPVEPLDLRWGLTSP
jgi:glyoxylase-like metal-dependent hydrolase (beta-lactamase superfamily II)